MSLDELSGSAKTSMKACYSLKRKFTSYTGPMILVVRSSDDAELDFYGDYNGVLNSNFNRSGTDINTWLGSSTGYIRTWYDQSGKGNNATGDSYANYRPKYDSSKSINFYGNNSSNDYGTGLDIPAGTMPTGNNPFTVIFKLGSPAFVFNNRNKYSLLGGNILDSTESLGIALFNIYQATAIDYEQLSNLRAAFDNAILTTLHSTTTDIYINSTYDNSISFNCNIGNIAFCLGNNGYPNVDSCFKGKMKECFIFDTALNEADRLIAEEYVLVNPKSFCCGTNAGKYTTNADINITKVTDNVFIGKDTRGYNDADKQVAIGYDARGLGSTTTVLGNSSVTGLYCNVSSITNVSDERDKKNIINLKSAIDTILNINPVKFIWNPRDNNANTGKKAIGFTAQNLQEACDRSDISEYLTLVDSTDPDHLKINQNDLLPLITKAIQELIITNNKLEKKLYDMHGIIV